MSANDSTRQPGRLERLAIAWWRVRRGLKNALPITRRRTLNKLARKYEALLDAAASSPPASAARVRVVSRRQTPAGAEVCLFVTHALRPAPKPHVIAHVEHLLDAGFEVILVVARDGDLDRYDLPPALAGRLAALLLRENVGFDFAAWSHAFQLCVDPARVSRLLMVNDSIVGPLDREAYARLLQRLRASTEDVVGLTFNPRPWPHIQSYFLAFGPRALAMPEWRRMWASMCSLPSKDQVIEVYETQLTRRMIAMGLRTATLFPLPLNPRRPNNVRFRWKQLVEIGFPFVKGSIVREQADDPDLQRLVPEVFRRQV